MARLLITLLCIIASGAKAEEPIILIMVDGARPDYVNYYSQQGQLPNIKQYFIDQGSVFENSFTSMSLTVPSWSAILSGKDIDRTTIKGNDIFNRQNKHIENYLDWRVDILDLENKGLRNHGRAYQLLREYGHKTILDYFNRPKEDSYGKDSEVYATFFPLNDQFPLYLFGTALDNLFRVDTAKQTSVHNALIRLIYEDKNFYALDRDNVDQVLKVIHDRKSPMKKLILLYFATVDHYAHQEHGKGVDSLKLVDAEIGRVMRAINRSRYKNATVAIVSDHGSQGGMELDSETSQHPLKGKSYGLTATNINSFLSGWMNVPGLDQYAFNVTSTFANEGKFSLRNWNEFQAHFFQCTNVALSFIKSKSMADMTCQMLHKNPFTQSLVHAGITTTQTIAIPYGSAYSNDWTSKNNWYTLTNYEVSAGNRRNLIKDLENFQITNIKLYSPDLENKISKFPLDWLAIPVSKESVPELQATADLLLLHHSEESQALIMFDGVNYRYIPVKNFQQDASGRVSYSLNTSTDPLGYLRSSFVNRQTTGNFIDDNHWFNNFHSPREWASRYGQTSYPNAVAAVYRTFYFRDEGLKAQESERMDILLNPKYGHIFTIENDDLETQHGMFQRESVNNTFMIRGPRVRQGYRHKEPVFSVDLLPTVFRASGKSTPAEIQGMGLDGEPIESIFQSK